MIPPLHRMRRRSFYGDKNQSWNPKSSSYGRVRDRGHVNHQGWDLSAPPGTPVYAICKGECVHVAPKDTPNPFDHSGFYGRHIVLKFISDEGVTKGSTYYAFYAHLEQVFVRTGDSVPAGQIIGLSGMSGNAKKLPVDQAHLHFEVRTIPRTSTGLPNHLDPSLFFPLPEAENQNFVSPTVSGAEYRPTRGHPK